MKLVKAMITIAGMTSISRITGFIRDILTAGILGAGPIADAFFVALKLPNLFRRITAEGAFSVSFVPLYTQSLEKERPEDSAHFVDNSYSIMCWSLFAFVAFILIVMPWVIYVIAPGFHGDEVRYNLAIELSRITFPYLFLISLSSLMGGVLNAHDRFAPYAAAPILFNLTLICALLFFSPVMESPGHAMAWGVVIAGILQFVFLYYNIKLNGFQIHLIRPKFDKKTRKLFKLMGPGIIGAGVMHINLFADLVIASMLDTGSISYLYYADRLNQLPLGIVGIAVGTALLPMLSRSISSGHKHQSSHLFSRALEICFLLAIPAAIGLFMLSLPIIITLFEHGKFTRLDSLMTTLVLTAYSVGMPAYVSVKVLSSAYWAKQDTLTPVKVSIVSTLINIALSVWLAFYMNLGVLGIAVGTTVAGWLQFILLKLLLRRYEDVRLDRTFGENICKIVASSMLMAVYLYFCKVMIQSSSYNYIEVDLDLGIKILIISLLVGGGALIYGLGIFLSGVIKMQDIRKLFKRGTSW